MSLSKYSMINIPRITRRSFFPCAVCLILTTNTFLPLNAEILLSGHFPEQNHARAMDIRLLALTMGAFFFRKNVPAELNESQLFLLEDVSIPEWEEAQTGNKALLSQIKPGPVPRFILEWRNTLDWKGHSPSEKNPFDKNSDNLMERKSWYSWESMHNRDTDENTNTLPFAFEQVDQDLIDDSTLIVMSRADDNNHIHAPDTEIFFNDQNADCWLTSCPLTQSDDADEECEVTHEASAADTEAEEWYPCSRYILKAISRVARTVQKLARGFILPQFHSVTTTIGETRYTYLIRTGKKNGIAILLHGILANKELFTLFLRALIQQREALPTLIIPDLLAHGDQALPEDEDYSLQKFIDHMATFIMHMKGRYSHQPVILVGHSLGGGIAGLMKRQANITADALILISSIGLDDKSTGDFKDLIAQHEGLPFDFGSSEISKLIDSSFGSRGILVSSLIAAGCQIYARISDPVITRQVTKMFRDLEASRKALLAETCDEACLRELLDRPLHLIWTDNDGFQDKSRYIDASTPFAGNPNLHCHEQSGSHAWILEHPHKAAQLISNILEKILDGTPVDQGTFSCMIENAP